MPRGSHLPLAPRPPRAPLEPENVTNTKPSALVHLGRSPAQAKANSTAAAPSAQPAYGYGLELNLDDDATNKLGMTQPPPVGSTVHATVQMHVNSASSDPTVGGKAKHRVGMTVTHMKIHGAPAGPAAKVARAPASPSTPRGKVAVASHVRRAPAKVVKGPRATHSKFVRPPTVTRA